MYFFGNPFPTADQLFDQSTARAVFLDRDGVLNRAIVIDGRPYPPRDLGQLEILPGVPEALVALRKAGYLLIVVTNQPDVGRGTQKKETVDAIHAHLRELLPLDDIMICWNADGAGSECYKPKPGMLLEAAAQHRIDLQRSFMVGDRWRDIGAGNAAGTFTIFIDYGYRETLLDKPNAVVHSLPEAASLILSEQPPGSSWR